ncbi:MAG: Hsp70 family protein [Fimbriimonadaceae bacterium]|nr:Hsp70 family protein [Fimbriimonadaceae bacterium]
MIVGFDFGTTNSLVSVVVGDAVIDVLEEDRPHPSVIRYEGEETIVGREAKDALEEVGLGVYGNTVRSPKMYLGQTEISVGGVNRSPEDIVADVIAHVRSRSKQSSQRRALGALDRAVVTIPVNMTGPRRAALRRAFRRAGISIVHFVHEPFAALYGYLRGAQDPDSATRKLMGRNVLVVDWGGGTLDLTLCRIEPGRIVQLRNGGTDQVGGDKFDEVIRDEVVARFSNTNGIADTDRPIREARLRLLHDAEENKIALSERPSVTFYRPAYFPESGATLNYPLSRQELDEITRPLVRAGIHEVESLLDTVDMAPAEVSLCLLAGGMAAMPSIRSQLHQLFGPQKVEIPDNSGTLISQGAAWMAHDTQRLVLAKPIELEMARGYRLPILRAGTAMPTVGNVHSDRFHLYCTDPSDGSAKFSIVAPTEHHEQPQASDPRTSIGMFTVDVDKTAPPLVERLELDVEINDDLILTVTAESSQRKGRARATYFDLEFGIGLPGSEGPLEVTEDSEAAPATGGLAVRANVADRKDQSLVPGDVLYQYKPSAFARLSGPKYATEEQTMERLYYQPCSVCKKPWGDPSCRCASVA